MTIRRYLLDTFSIVREQDEAAFGEYRTKAMMLAGMEQIARDKLPL